MTETPDAERHVTVDVPLDLLRTFRTLAPSCPTFAKTPDGLWRAARFDDKPATVLVTQTKTGVQGRAWGPGADLAIAKLEDLLGLNDNLESFVPQHDVLREGVKKYRGTRLGRGWPVMATLVHTICEQKVTSVEAQRSWRSLCYKLGEPAPGPHPTLRLAAHSKVLAGIPEYGYRVHGIDRQRAEVIMRASQVAHRLRKVEAMGAVDAAKFLVKVRGIGAWTAWGTVERTHGHPDGVLIGDYHVPNLVCWALAGEVRGDDARMVELLEPYRGHRMRVVRLLERTVGHAPRFGPRRTIVEH